MAKHPGPFQGVGVYFTSEVHSARSNGHFAPIVLVEVLANLLDYQQRIIEESDGIVEQFVGDCVVAFWPPSDMNILLPRVNRAAQRIIREKPVIANLDYRIAIHYCASELARAFFGSSIAFRFQVIGRSRSRLDALPRSIPGQDCALTDADTVAAMSLELRAIYQPFSTTAYAMKLTA